MAIALFILALVLAVASYVMPSAKRNRWLKEYYGLLPVLVLLSVTTISHCHSSMQRAGVEGDSASIAEAYFYSGVESFSKRDYIAAIASYDSAIVYKHDKHEAWSNRGAILYELGRFEETAASFDSADVYKR